MPPPLSLISQLIGSYNLKLPLASTNEPKAAWLIPQKIIYLGEGPYLKIYETLHGKLVTKQRIFENQRVHSIKCKLEQALNIPKYSQNLIHLSVFNIFHILGTVDKT